MVVTIILINGSRKRGMKTQFLRSRLVLILLLQLLLFGLSPSLKKVRMILTGLIVLLISLVRLVLLLTLFLVLYFC